MAGPGEQQLRPQAEREMPEWQREALDRERSRPRTIDDVLSALESQYQTLANIQARLYVIEKQLGHLLPDKSDDV